MREISIASNFVLKNTTRQTIEMSSSALADEVRIQWPDVLETILSVMQVGQTILVDHRS